jgi:predicted enzyme related to lactoylglutathione lyase
MADQRTDESVDSGGGVDDTLARHGGLSYLEIPAVNPRLSAMFYAEVLGWHLRGGSDEEPKFSDGSGHLIGRWVTGRDISRDAGIMLYFYVNHIEDCTARAADYGGEVVRPTYAEGNLRVAEVRDPAGNLIGLWEEFGRCG